MTDAHLLIIVPLAWAGILAFAVFLYVLLDGFDLGVGILFPFVPSHDARDTMMNSVAPVWDGNETWLVLGGAGLFAAFPMAYSVMLPALYLPLILMLIGLILRGVAFEFRFKAKWGRALWDWSFAGGSMLAASMQGVALGAFIQGFEVDGRVFAGGPFDWLTPFSVFTGIALVAGYVLLACGWLIIKVEGTLLDWVYAVAPKALLAILFGIAVVSLWSPFLNDDIAGRWFTFPSIVMVSPVPLLTIFAAAGFWRAVSARALYLPFVFAVVLFFLCYTGLAVSLFPYIVPPRLTIWDAAADLRSQIFVLYGLIPILPVILGYTAYSYYVFRGKVGVGGGYH